MEAEPGGPPDIETLRNIMMLVSICWNLPIPERKHAPELKKDLHLLEQIPEPLRELLDRLMEDRRTKFGSIPFLVLVAERLLSIAVR